MLKLRFQRQEKSGEECPFKESKRSKSTEAERLVSSQKQDGVWLPLPILVRQ